MTALQLYSPDLFTSWLNIKKFYLSDNVKNDMDKLIGMTKEIRNMMEQNDIYNDNNDEDPQLLVKDALALIKDSVTKEELEAEYLSYVNRVIKDNEDRVKKNEALKNRYNAMLSKVRRWTPPSKEYEGVKDFMESQLIDSLDFDCRHVYVENIIPKDEWIQKQSNRTDLIKSMKYNLEQYNKSVVAAEKDTQWLKIFSESIKKVTE